MADTLTLALEKLYNDVVARFVAEGTICDSPFGWRAPAQQQTTLARIAWVPGNPSGGAGKDAPARNPGRNPRSIGTFLELFTVYISASDPTAAENELAQYKATRLLRDAWHRAVYLAAHGTFTIESEDWITGKNERRFGAAMRLVCSIQSMIPDTALQSVPVDTSAVIGLAELNVTETLTAAAEAP